MYKIVEDDMPPMGATFYEENGRYFACLRFKERNPDGVLQDVIVPRICLPFSGNDFGFVDVKTKPIFSNIFDMNSYIVCGEHRFPLEKTDMLLTSDTDGSQVCMKGYVFRQDVPVKMTKKDIEEALGYPIEIVKEK